MRNWKPFFAPIASLLLVLAFPVRSFDCAYYDPETFRFWLFQPGVEGLEQLLPFTYSTNPFYLEPDAADSAHYLINVQEWKKELGGQVDADDVYRVLYQTPPEEYFSGKIDPNNSFLTALRQPAKAGLLDYLDLAKTCESVMSDSPREKLGAAKTLKDARDKVRVQLGKAKTPFLRHRLYFQDLKLSGYLSEGPALRKAYEAIDKDAAPGSWVRKQALYNRALNEPDSLQRNYWLSKAFDGGVYNRFWVYRCFRPSLLDKTLPLAKSSHEKAVLHLMAVLNNPGKGLENLKKAYDLDPGYADLSMLLSREINKLDDWILTPKLTGGFELRMDISYEDRINAQDRLRADLAYLHEVLDFVEKTAEEGKRPDPELWHLSAAHLAVVDGDATRAKKHLAALPETARLPLRLQVQARLGALLVNLLEKPSIDAGTEQEIAGVFRFLEENGKDISEGLILQWQLALYLSDAYLRQGQVAKSVLMLSKSRQNWQSRFGERVFYQKLLEVGKPDDYDALLAYLQQTPQSDFDKWLVAQPLAYDFGNYGEDNTYIDTVGRYIPAPKKGSTWDLDKIREFKATYFIWQNQIDNAYAVLKEIPPAYWQRDYPDLAKTNPYDIGIELPGVSLGVLKPSNKAELVRTMMELEKEAAQQPGKRQQNLLLLANAWFNMTWMGSWWPMYHTKRSSAEFLDPRGFHQVDKRTGQTKKPFLPWSVSFGFLGLAAAAAGWRLRKKGLYAVALALGLAACWGKQEPPKTVTAVSPEKTAFDSVYFAANRAREYYMRSLEAGPGTELGVVAAYMAGMCQRAAEIQAYYTAHPDDYYPDDATVAKTLTWGPASYGNKLAPGARYSGNTSCAYFREFLSHSSQ